MPKPIPVNDLKRHFHPHEAVLSAALARVLKRGHFILGPELEALEAEFAEYCGCRSAVGVANGTDALELGLRALGVNAGDPVATVANAGGYSTTAILAIGAHPRYVDVDAATCTMEAVGLAALLAKESVRAVVVTHLYGRMADLPAILAVADYYRVPVLEDCAQAHGARLNGRRAGSFGRAAAFSFYPTKNLGAIGDGGAIVTSNPAVAAAIRELRQYGWSAKYRASRPDGCNSRLDEVQAAVLRCLLPHLDAWNERRREIMALYQEHLGHTGLRLPPPADESHVGHLYVVRTPRRDRLRERLAEQGIGCDVHYPVPDYAQPAFAPKCRPLTLPVTEDGCRTALTLPCFPEMTDAEARRVATAVRQAVAEATDRRKSA